MLLGPRPADPPPSEGRDAFLATSRMSSRGGKDRGAIALGEALRFEAKEDAEEQRFSVGSEEPRLAEKFNIDSSLRDEASGWRRTALEVGAASGERGRWKRLEDRRESGPDFQVSALAYVISAGSGTEAKLGIPIGNKESSVRAE
ncbi:hypothetical protein KM043_000345 [Ampulex compressa]|nr:hypothetical protein KM043_000345 [Ampulex compressa]